MVGVARGVPILASHQYATTIFASHIAMFWPRYFPGDKFSERSMPASSTTASDILDASRDYAILEIVVGTFVERQRRFPRLRVLDEHTFWLLPTAKSRFSPGAASHARRHWQIHDYCFLIFERP